jgi:RND superfamily putative drug exporter
VRRVALALADRFPARGTDPVTVIADTDPDSTDFGAWLEQVADLPGVVGTSIRPDTPDGVTVVDVTPAGTSQGPAASALVDQLRSTTTSFGTQVGGIAAELIDVKARLSERLPFAALMVVAATLLLLFLMTGSVMVPIKAVIMNVLSLGASFGALVWIFQEGHLAGVLGFDSVGALDLWMPVLILIFAFGLSMDYEVFLLSRIKEVHDETGDSDLAVAVGLQRSGRIITAAAFLIVIVFTGFAAGEVLAIKQLGVGLAIAVLVDATIVRTLLVPATMKLLGERNWWAPAPLRRLYHRFGLHEAPSSTPHTAEGRIYVGLGGDGADDEHEPVGAGSGKVNR